MLSARFAKYVDRRLSWCFPTCHSREAQQPSIACTFFTGSFAPPVYAVLAFRGSVAEEMDDEVGLAL